ncbi:hypothetical protein ASG63_16370 [Methylobacterium sp. Leaf94]|uniref:hypothetical protein n=1 Tax=Methylobacterium sp. Leaf94 TaxID=1736250 RepID=UPI0006F9414E|nr:hypothetical protein [Methylobacterium sp. Leaf94]KQU31073.1 hypothetical protein ASG63_16370 [Methylobacterium sp. Leaf94]
MGTYILIITLFTVSTGNPTSITPAFQSMELCEAAKAAYVKAAADTGGLLSGGPTLIAVCARTS